MNRRGLIKSAAGLFVAANAGLLLPEEPIKRFWSGWSVEPPPAQVGGLRNLTSGTFMQGEQISASELESLMEGLRNDMGWEAPSTIMMSKKMYLWHAEVLGVEPVLLRS